MKKELAKEILDIKERRKVLLVKHKTVEEELRKIGLVRKGFTTDMQKIQKDLSAINQELHAKKQEFKK